MTYFLSPDVFFLKKADGVVIFAPKIHFIALVSEKGMSIVDKTLQGDEDLDHRAKDFIAFLIREGVLTEEKVENPTSVERTHQEYKPSELLLFPTSRCNLRCSYCYADGGDYISDMPFKYARIGIETIISNAKELKKKGAVLKFHGGGEPFMNFALMKESVDYFRRRTAEESLDSIAYTITNGVLSQEETEWLVNNLNYVTISVDGPDEVQNLQRPLRDGRASFPFVYKTIQYLEKIEFPYSIRITVTNSDYANMSRIYEFFLNNTQRKRIHFEPLDFCGRCQNSNLDSAHFDIQEFADNLMKLITRGLVDQRSVYCAAYNNSPGHTYCGASSGINFAITTDGCVSTCTQVTRATDVLANIFIIGRVNEDMDCIEIDQDRLEVLRSRNIFTLKPCQDCYAKWYCMGGCPVRAARRTNYVGVSENNCILSKSLLNSSIDMFLQDRSTFRYIFNPIYP